MFGTLFKKVNKTNRRLGQPEETGSVQRFRLHMAAITVAGGALVALVIWGGMMLEDPRTLPITSVEIQGEFHYLEKQQIQQALNGRLEAGFFNVDVDAIRDILLDIPWVNAATVRRVWPDTLQIGVVEQLPIARWIAGGLVNNQGQLFFPLPETYPPDLPELQGPVDSQAVVAMRYREMEKELEPLALHINRIVLDERRSWKIELNSGVTLLLGRANDNARLTRFTRLYPVALAARAADIEQVDLRYTNGFSVRWKT